MGGSQGSGDAFLFRLFAVQLHIERSGGGGLCHRLLQFLVTDILATGEQGGALHHICSVRAGCLGQSYEAMISEALTSSPSTFLPEFLVGVLDKEVGKEEDIGTSVLEGRHL